MSYQTVRRLRSLLWQCKSKQSRWRNARCKRKSSETTNNLNVSLSSLAFLTNYSHMQNTHTHTHSAKLKLTEDKETDSNNARAPPLQLLCNFTARRGEKKKRKKKKGPLPYSPSPRYLNRKLPDASISRAVLSNRANELRGRRVRDRSGTDSKIPLCIPL